MTYTVTEARSKHSELIKQVEAGDRVTITKRGVPVVEMVRKGEAPRRKRIFGGFESDIEIYDADWARPQNDFDAWSRGEV